MKLKKLFLTFALAAICASADAVPAKRGQWITAELADGSKVRVELVGDEFCSFFRAEDGRCFVRNAETGLFEPAEAESLQAKAAARRISVMENRKKIAAKTATLSNENNKPFQGKFRSLIILVDFPDRKFDAAHTLELYKDVFNKENFTHEMGFKGSARDYFLAQSRGAFDINFDVLGPVTMKENYAYYGKPVDGNNDSPMALAEMVRDACVAVDGQINFGDYDWNGDGVVDQVFVFFAGHGEATNPDDPNTIWPHQWDITAASGGTMKVELDGVRVENYACSCELNELGKIAGVGTFCHEFSHCLGLPDMYDYGGMNYGMGLWDVMDRGSYNGNGFLPSNYTSYECMFIGWRQPVELTEPCKIKGLPAYADGGDAYIIYNDAHKDEYYLLENRQLKGWDAALPNSGLLITHVDYSKSAWDNNIVNSTFKERCTIFKADNLYLFSSTWEDLFNDSKGDIYPFEGNDGLTDETKPAARLNNANTDGSKLMHKPITEITRNDDGTVSFVFMNYKEPTSIDGITVDGKVEDNRVFSIDGRYLGNDLKALKKGIYIRNGKKVIR